ANRDQRSAISRRRSAVRDQLRADLFERSYAVDVSGQLVHADPWEALEASVDFRQVFPLLRFPRAVKLSWQVLGQHAVDDETADVDAGLGEKLGRARGFFDCQAFGDRYQRERGPRPVHDRRAQSGDALAAPLERPPD